MAKPWQARPTRGEAVDLPVVIAMAAGPDPGAVPRVHSGHGRVYVHYSRTRLYLARSAWEALPTPADVLVLRICPADGPSFTIALTRAELDRVFGAVRETRSWDAARCYHFPTLPPALDSFRVGGRPVIAAQVGKPRLPPAEASRMRPATASTPAPSPTHALSAGTIGAWAANWAARTGGTAESEPYLASVAAWRDAWRPSQIRALLIAESHVGEAPGDTAVRVQMPQTQLALPNTFCRLVYCLGYGENALCSPAPIGNNGTLQFWDIFGAIAGGSQPRQPRKSESGFDDRVRWKLEVLTWLRDHGVWLIDACVAGIYLPGGSRAVTGATYDKMVAESFSRFVWPRVSGEPLQQVWVIGAGVRRALEGHPALRSARTIIQPQGDRSSPGRHIGELASMVEAIRLVVPERS